MANSTKTQTLHSFWSSFGLTAYDESTVPTGENAPDFPYITYTVATGSLEDELFLTASLWYRSSSWAAAETMAQTIEDTIGYGGKMLKYDGGALRITRGAPFAQRMADPDDDMIRRMYMNVNAEFITQN